VLLLLLSNESIGVVVCKNGVVSRGSSYDELKKKCNLKNEDYGLKVRFKSKDAKKNIYVDYKKLDMKLDNGEEVSLVFLDDQLMVVSK
jgi:phage-related protein